MITTVEDMYVMDEELLPTMMEKLFPSANDGCINFGYWDKITLPISLEERIASQKQLYMKVFDLIPIESNKVLEVGCGRGHGVNWLSQKGKDVIGVDVLRDQLKLCKHNYPDLQNQYLLGKADNLPVKNNTIDVVYSVEAAQHFPSFDGFCSESAHVLKNDGLLIVTTYFFTNEKSKQSVARIIPDDVVGFDHAITVDKAIQLARNNGFDLERAPISIGAHVFPFYSQWQKQMLGDIRSEQLSIDQLLWEPYYTGGGALGEHPWGVAYKNGWIDYNILIFRLLK